MWVVAWESALLSNPGVMPRLRVCWPHLEEQGLGCLSSGVPDLSLEFFSWNFEWSQERMPRPGYRDLLSLTEGSHACQNLGTTPPPHSLSPNPSHLFSQSLYFLFFGCTIWPVGPQFPDQGSTQVPCTGSLNHWTTREVSLSLSSILSVSLFLLPFLPQSFQWLSASFPSLAPKTQTVQS